MNENKFNPDYNIHPFETLLECVQSDVVVAQKFTQGKLGELYDKMKNGGYYTPYEAELLSNNISYPKSFWMNLQMNYISKRLTELESMIDEGERFFVARDGYNKLYMSMENPIEFDGKWIKEQLRLNIAQILPQNEAPFKAVKALECSEVKIIFERGS